MRVVVVAAEMVPLAKVGGLADVVGGLSKTLAKRGHEVCVMLPAYGSSASAPGAVPHPMCPSLEIPFGKDRLAVSLRRTRHDGVEVVLVDIPALFADREEIYAPEPAADAGRFIAFCRAVSAFLSAHSPRGGLVHLHDHHAALVAPMLVEGGGWSGPIVLTIHNLAYQGLAPAELFPRTGLPESLFRSMGACEYFGRINPLKAGILYSHAVTTVSPTYGAEIVSGEHGFGLEGVVQESRAKISGILNGIDTEIWSPAVDPHLDRPYRSRQAVRTILDAKQANARGVRGELGLTERGAPLVAFVGRMTSQKGVDLLVDAVPEILRLGCQVAILGQGEAGIEEAVRRVSAAHPGEVACRIGFEEALAHRLIAGASFLAVPSRFEPCGVTSIYAQAYGTIPIARRTGGLIDIVKDIDEHPADGTGLLFGPPTGEALGDAVRRAVSLCADRKRHGTVLRRAMLRDFSWDRLGDGYERLFLSLMSNQAKRAEVGK
ncbi:MAG: glycogen synthase [Planctomycetes bacterium]|nr:glycogen synthase [Planctomycetota bacterium]